MSDVALYVPLGLIQELFVYAWRSLLIVIGLCVALGAFLLESYGWATAGLVAAIIGGAAIIYRKRG